MTEDPVPLVASQRFGRVVPAPKSTRGPFWFAAGLAAILGGCKGFSVLPSAVGRGADAMIGYLAGSATGMAPVIGFPIWLALYFLVVRKNNSARGGPYLAALLAIPLIAGIVVPAAAYAVLGGQARHQATAAISEIKALDAEVNAAQKVLNRDYTQALARTRWNALFTVEGVSDPRNLDEALARLETAQRLHDDYADQVDKSLRQRRAKLSEVLDRHAFPAPHRDQVLANSDRSDSATRTALNLESQAFADTEALARVLLDSRGRWRVQDGRLTFERPGDMQAYNEALEAIRATGATQVTQSPTDGSGR